MEYIFTALAVAAGILIAYTVFGTVFGTVKTIVRASDKSSRKKEEKLLVCGNDEIDGKLVSMRAEGLEWLSERPYEEHTIKSFDGLTLKGKFFRTENARATVMLVHGYRSWPERDFGTVVKFFGENGFNIFMHCHRAHGKSEGKYITFGVLDRFDLRDWTCYVDNLCDRKLPILWDGISMGGATVCMASALDLPENLKAIVSDCPFTTPKEEIAHSIKLLYHLPAFPLVTTIGIVTKTIARYGFTDCDSREEVSKTKIPMFIAHGEADGFVPTYMGVEIYNACASPKELFTVPGAIHGFSYIVATEEYQKKLSDFLERNGFYS